ncbi:COG2426 family protein [Bacillus solimangrovi]|uniref:Ligand-binding protein SH3 n=1 Tax=Bacillus solimangrovi TaxID=1305675 RepID=A0A1E5LBM7_9BACI|nr:small multi-drug export protein [Bacillus solimangrovi]OEH91492.1 ligand-binding protein SH3 [Bacillus solimangrovi]
MKEKLTDFVINNFGFLPPELIVIIVSAMPILELRGGLPLAYGFYEFSFWKSFSLSLFGNFLPIIPLLLLFQPLSNWMLRFNWYGKLYNWLYNRTLKKSGNVEKYGAVGLVLFTAVPIPTTGAYIACVAATIFSIRFRYAVIAITTGIFIAGLMIGLLSYSAF